MEQLTDIRPKLKHNALFIQTEDGFFVTGEGAGFQLKGKSIVRWVTALRPLMTGDYTLGQICARLEPAQREHVTQIMTTLLQKGVIKNKRPEQADILPTAVHQQFRSQIEYLDHFVDYPLERFRAFRESALLLCGSGESLKALALFLLRNGLRTLSLSPTDTSDDYLTVLKQEETRLRQQGSEVHIVLVPPALRRPAEYDALIYCADNGSFRELFTLNQLCVHERRMFLAVTPFANQVLLGPLVRPDTGPCWLCAMMRLSANSDDQAQAALWREVTLGEVTPRPRTPLFLPIARRIGHGLGFELFKTLSACLPSETEQGVIFQNLENLESSRSPLVRHPLCPVCSHVETESVVSRLHQVVDGAREHISPDQEIYEHHQRLFDRSLGVFSGFADEEKEQIPLKQARIIGGSPVSFNQRELDVTAFSLDTPLSARVQALKQAVGQYSELLIDRRGMPTCSQQELAEQGKVALLPQELATWSGILSLMSSDSIAWYPAFSVCRNSTVYVPAAAIYPMSALNHQGLFIHTTAGAAVESSFEQTLTQGLLSALVYVYVRNLQHGRSAIHEIDPDTLEALDEADAHFLVRSAQRFARPFTLKEVRSDLPLNMIIAHTTDGENQPIIAAGLQLSRLASVKAALQRLVEGLQMQEAGDPFPGDEHGLAGFLTQQDNAMPRNQQSSRMSQFHESALDLTQLKSALFQAGRDIIFAHTTGSDLWEVGTLISGRVLLTQSGAGLAGKE